MTRRRLWRHVRGAPSRGHGATAAWVCALSIAISSSHAHAAEDTSLELRERGKLAAKEERRIQAAPVRSLDRQRDQAQRERASQKVAAQIPEALRATLQHRIDERISRNLQRVRTLRGQALTMLRELLASLPNTARERPRTLMRLGELTWEQQREVFLEKFAAYEALPMDARGEPPRVRYAESRAYFREVLEQHTGCPDYDLALYVDGFLATEEGQTEQALERFNRILAEFPRSPFVPDAHMVRAEAEFAKNEPNVEFALAEYEAVLAHPDTHLYDLALFKSAWALWRLGKSEEAAKRFLGVFRGGARQRSQPSGRRDKQLEELQAEALKNLVAVFVEDESNTAQDMHRFLVDAGGAEFAGEIVEALAATLYEQAHYGRGAEAYRLLLQLRPKSPQAFHYALRVAEAHATMEMWPELASDYRFLVRAFVAPRPSSEAQTEEGKADLVSATGWTPFNASGWRALQSPEVLSEAKAAVAQQLYKDALGLHAKAQSDGSRSEFEAAAGLYEVYMESFPAGQHAYEVSYNLGDIHYHRLGHLLPAADAYMAAATLNPHGKWSRDALHNALAALESAREAEFAQAKSAKTEPRETETDRKLTAALELYGTAYPDDPELPSLLFRQGRLYYDYEVFDPAVRLWGLLLERHPRSAEARNAGELLLDSLNRSKDFENIEVWGRRLLPAPAFADARGQTRLTTFIVQAIFKQAEQEAEQGEHVSAAQHYLRVTEDFADHERAPEAAVNAALEAKSALDLELMRRSVALLMGTYRGSSVSPRGVWEAAVAHQSVGLLTQAADYYEALASYWPKDTHHQQSSFNAVLLWSSLGNRDAAVRTAGKYRATYPKGALNDEVTFLLGKVHEKAGELEAAAELYEAYARAAPLASRRIEALVRLALVNGQLGKSEKHDQAVARAMKEQSRHRRSLDERGRYYGAQAHFLSARQFVERYEKIALTGEVQRLKRALKEKASLLKQASERLLETAKLGVAEWTTAALYEVGHLYESFARTLLDSPPPEGLSEDQLDAYQMQIDEFVIPIEEKGLEAYESGWLKAVELGIFNSWTAKMRAALGRLNTEVYPPLKQIGLSLSDDGATALPELIHTLRRTDEGTSRPFLMETSRAATAPHSRSTGGAPPVAMARREGGGR